MGQIVKETDILCCGCQEAYMQVETPGSETKYWLRCPKCGEYIYFIGKILCVGGVNCLSIKEEAWAILGPQSLLHEIEKKISLGLDEWNKN